MSSETELAKAEMALHKYERSYCECNKCKAGCKSMPGMMSPEDVVQVATYCGSSPDDDIEQFKDWTTDHLAASEGATVIMSNGTTRRIPAIVPQQHANGQCVFLDKNDRCTIHPVSPFGCRQFKVCDGDDQELDNKKSRSALNVISMHTPYQALHNFLEESGATAPPVLDRKQKLEELLEGDRPHSP